MRNRRTAEPTSIRVAVIGRPNSGKSTLVNRLLGEERLLTGPEAGITRDAIAVDVTWRGRDFRIHDTAGLRRRARVEEKLEKLSVADAINAMRFAEVVILLVDAQTPFEEQDLRIADLVEREGRAVVIGMNKWDLVEGSADAGAGAMKRLREETDHRLPQLKGVPVVAISGLTGAGLDRLMQAVIDAHAVWNKRATTERAQSLARRRRVGASAAGGVGPAHPPRLCDPAKSAPADLRAVRKPYRCGAGRLPALSRQQPARDVRATGHTDPADAAGEGESLRQQKEAIQVTILTLAHIAS